MLINKRKIRAGALLMSLKQQIKSVFRHGGLFILLSASGLSMAGTPQHGIAMHGDLKYPVDFRHFDYVNPNAPKGGVLKQSSLGSFDSLNPFIIKGAPATGLGLIYDSLMEPSSDEPFSKYGLLAKTVTRADDNSWVEFELNQAARFHDGKPVTAEDVIFTFTTLMRDGRPFYRAYYADIAEITQDGDYKVRFNFKTTENAELPLIIGQVPILPKHYWQDKDFKKTTLEAPLGSGPYKIGKIDNGRSITYQRNPDYWGKSLPINVGRYNFDQVVYEYYRDGTVALEAFKAGNLSFRRENSSKFWATAYDAPAVKDGRIVKEEINHQNPTGMQAFAFNLRRDQFKNKQVRQALNLAFDFEWTNKNLFYGAYSRTGSYFSNSELASRGLPSKPELELLEPFRSQLDPAIFKQAFKLNSTSGDGKNRKELRQASRLLTQAGWKVVDGKRVDQNGKPVVIEMLLYDTTFERVVNPFKKNLKRLGIELNLRIVDTTQYINRVRSFDFDMIVHSVGQSNSPGNEQREFWHSEYANKPDSSNIMGISNPVIDALVERVITAKDRSALVTASRALDRVLLSGYYVIPQWNLPAYRVAYWKNLKHPVNMPPFDLAIDAWWHQE
jgi:microcin C transport system substrate-binding protein